LLDIQNTAHRDQQIRTIDEVLCLMADGIRNPLAAISGAIQVLQRMEPGQDAEGARDDPVSVERRQIYNCIVRESVRLDHLIEGLINGVQFSPERLSDMLEEIKTREAVSAEG
jgi:nitrogen-specific signal transduction histidine kinase